MESVNLVTASKLLGICRQRIQQLIYANRVKGAFKTKKGWRIPLYNDMPCIIPAKRGRKGTWRTLPLRQKRQKQIIHINRQKIAINHSKKKDEAKEPVIAVRRGSKVHYGHRVSVEGKCTVVYDPNNKKKHGGAKVWIEVSPTTPIKITNWNQDHSDSRDQTADQQNMVDLWPNNMYS